MRAADDGEGSNTPHGLSLRFGNLNLLCPANRAAYDVWKTGTEQLIARKPVTRDEAVEPLHIAARSTRRRLTATMQARAPPS